MPAPNLRTESSWKTKNWQESSKVKLIKLHNACTRNMPLHENGWKLHTWWKYGAHGMLWVTNTQKQDKSQGDKNYSTYCFPIASAIRAYKTRMKWCRKFKCGEYVLRNRVTHYAISRSRDQQSHKAQDTKCTITQKWTVIQSSYLVTNNTITTK